MNNAHRELNIEASEHGIIIKLQDRRPEIVEFFTGLTEAQRLQLATDAWDIGLRALRTAHHQAQESRLADVGKSLMEDFRERLDQHVADQRKAVDSVLAHYFNPEDGHVTQRLEEFVADEGAVARVLQRFVGDDGSILADTLARQVGENSTLIRSLSPTESTGVIQVMASKLGEVMSAEHDAFVKALDPLHPDGAVARFLRQLRADLQGAETDRAKQQAKLLAALDANDPNSLISRLVLETEKARQNFSTAVNPELPGSPMAMLKTVLVTLLERHLEKQNDALNSLHLKQENFQKEVLQAVTRLETKRTETGRSPRGGIEFEALVGSYILEVTRGGPFLVSAVGTTVGVVSGCKVGDHVIRFTEESAFHGAAVVFEAKRESGYTVARALEELNVARQNRDAGVGVFVLAQSHAPADFPRFGRYGNNVIVVWDHEDAATDPFLHASIVAAAALAGRTKRPKEAGDINALRDVEQRVVKEIERLDKMAKANENIRKNSDAIADELRKGKDKLDILIRKAKDTLIALNIDLAEEVEEAKSPIEFRPALGVDRLQDQAPLTVRESPEERDDAAL